MKWLGLRQNELPAFDEQLLFSLERRYFDVLDLARLELVDDWAAGFDPYSHLRMVHVSDIIHEGSAKEGLHLANFQNLLAAVREPGLTLVSLVLGDGGKSQFFYGLAKRPGAARSTSLDSYARIMSDSLRGNYLSIGAQQLCAEDLEKRVLRPLRAFRGRPQVLTGIPSLRDTNGSDLYAQGIDRFADCMRGHRYALLILAEPVLLPVIDETIDRLFNLGASIHSFVRRTIQRTRGKATTFNAGMFGMQGLTDATTESFSDSLAESEAEQFLGPGSVMTSLGTAIGAVLGTLVFPGIGTMVGSAVGSGLGVMQAFASGAPMSSVFGSAHSFTRSIANTTARTSGQGTFGGLAASFSRSVAVTHEMLNKKAEHCEKLCDQYTRRLQDGKATGFWNVGLYLLADRQAQQLGRSFLRSFLSGSETHWEPLRAMELDEEVASTRLLDFQNPRFSLFAHGEEKRTVWSGYEFGRQLAEFCRRAGVSVADFLTGMARKPIAERLSDLERVRQLGVKIDAGDFEQVWADVKQQHVGHPLGPIMDGVSTPLNTAELSIAMSFPRREVPGISIRSGAAFGANCDDLKSDRQIQLGSLVDHGTAGAHTTRGEVFHFPLDSLTHHAFVCGATRSGKTNSTIHLLRQLRVPFLVIEPAKSEYRQLINDPSRDVLVFTVGNENLSPLRLNPFEFERGVEVLTHIDYLKSVFNASFPMYASMPYLLEEAIIQVYADKGWNLAASTNRFLDASADLDLSDCLPTLEDLVDKIEQVVKGKGYAQQLRMDLVAALRARLGSLLCGSKGLALNTPRSTPLDLLLGRNVVLELKYLGDDDEKAFFMGLILTRLYEYREAERAAGILDQQPGNVLRHVTVIEEAHRLLRNVPEIANQEIANVRGKAVETFSNFISELGAYGESIVVVDSVPARLAPDVIKNTSLKIVHRTMAGDDRALVGVSMNLSDEQSSEAAMLRQGQAIVHSEDRDKAFLVKAPLATGDLGAMVTPSAIRDRGAHMREQFPQIFQLYPGFERDPAIREAFHSVDFRLVDAQSFAVIVGLAVVFAECRGEELFEAVRTSMERLSVRGTPTPREAQCRLIWYAKQYFRKLDGAYPGHYGVFRTAHRSFVSAWFDMAAGRSGAEPLTKYSEAMTAAIGSPYLPALRWYASVHGNHIGDLVRGLGSTAAEHGWQQVRQCLDDGVRDLALGIRLPGAIQARLRQELLDAILARDTTDSAVWRQLRTQVLDE